MGKPLFYDAGKIEVSQSFIDKIYNVYSDNMHFGAPISSSKTNELDLVRAVLEMLQGLSSNLFSWDEEEKRFCSKTGIHVSHLSLKSLHSVLNRFMYAATCLELVEIVVSKVEKWARTPPPTLRAFASSASAWLRRLRDISLKEQVKIANCGSKFTPTLLELVNSLSRFLYRAFLYIYRVLKFLLMLLRSGCGRKTSVCSGAEYLLHIVCGAIPQEYFDSVSSVLDADVAVHVLDYLFEKLDEVCLVQGSEEEEYQRVLHMFVGSLLPYMQGLDSWLFEGTLDDPFEEMFFYANKSTSIDDANFWEKSYLFRQAQCPQLDLELPAPTSSSSQGTMAAEKRGKSNVEFESCPLFIKDMAKAVVSAGKSLQLIRHIPVSSSGTNSKVKDCNSKDAFGYGQNLAGLTLSEAFCVSLAGLIGNGDHIFRYLCQDEWHRIKKAPPSGFSAKEKFSSDGRELLQSDLSKKIWYQFLVSTLSEKGLVDATNTHENESNLGEEKMTMEDESRLTPLQSFCTENPAINVCQQNLLNNRDAWKMLNLSRNFYLPPLNDVTLRTAIFGEECCSSSAVEGTNYSYGFQFGESDYQRSNHDCKILETLFPFPTVLPSFKEDCRMSELLPFQKNSTLPSRVLNWVQNFEPKNNVLPVVIIQECLTVFVKKQVDCIGSHMLSKLMNDWRLMEELAVLRAIYLLGSGDLLQHFLTLIFNKLDRGETWDDDFELNTILQESIRNSADSAIISAPDSLVVSLSENQGSSSDEQSNAVPSTSHESRGHIFGKDGLDLLKFTYKVPWPLELIANTEAIKKYNKVMGFLLKVKRAKFLLDKARRWMWKGRGNATNHCKRHWLLEQKLLHFVDAFHQYVMDRVYHSAWQELCKSMSEARSLDEVIEVHESYLLSIERQCFLVRDKLWVVIAERINSILKLALDFYSIQQTLSGGAVSSIKAKCETEIDRIDKDFDKCITFLLTILSFKLNVGNFPHLADLVTRINYNYFYMPDTGNLMTVLAS